MGEKMSDIYFKREVFEVKEHIVGNEERVGEFFNNLILYSLNNRVSDIHIEHLSNKIKIRIRIDGILNIYRDLTKEFGIKLLTKIKIISELDIGEKRLPQDGRFKGRYKEKNIDFRISFIPTIYGEKCVIRILKDDLENLKLDKMGFSVKNTEILKNIIKRKTGFIIFCGPTGSGKTTALYSLINEMDKEKLNIVTIEDPIEYQLDGINQIQCKNDIGLDFKKILRSVLRQDPDVILVGEIRDKETAEIAMMASLTGHMVLTTLHTRDSISAIDRLLGFNIDPYIIGSAITLIQSQRLIRKICKNCLGKGCELCINGFRGREAIEELVIIDDTISEYIKKGVDISVIKSYLKERGDLTLLDVGYRKVKEGITTEDEILRECII